MSPRSSSEHLPRPSAGFTLLEILIAISILAIVLTTVYGIVASISGAKDRLEQEGEVYQRVRIIYDRLGREIRGVCPVGGPAQKGVFRTGQDADGNPMLELTTTATAQLGTQQTGIALVRYSLAPDREKPAGQVLLRTEQSALVSDEALRETGPMRLAEGIAQMEWRFLIQDQWRTELDVTRDGLPLLVELTLTMTDSQGQTLPFRTAFDVPNIVWK